MNRKTVILALILLLVALAFYLYQQQRKRSVNELILYGNVDVRQVDLGFRVPGIVQKLFFEEGDLVEPGKLLALLDHQPYADQVDEAKARLESAKASLINAEQVLTRRQELIKDGSISQEDLQNSLANRDIQFSSYKQAEASLSVAQLNLSYTELFAPSEGTILTRIREPGSVVNVSEPVFTLSITSPVWIRAFCTEPQLGLIYPGMRAEIFTDTLGGKSYIGNVGFISPVAEFTPKTVETTQLRTDLVYRLRIYVENVDRGLRQGMPVTVRLQVNQDSK